jgi:hypothetical protein
MDYKVGSEKGQYTLLNEDELKKLGYIENLIKI